MGLEKIVHIKDDKIFELNNELLYYKNIYGNNLSLTSFDFPESNVSNSISICKKKKMDDYVKKKFYNNLNFLFIILEPCTKESEMFA